MFTPTPSEALRRSFLTPTSGSGPQTRGVHIHFLSLAGRASGHVAMDLNSHSDDNGKASLLSREETGAVRHREVHQTHAPAATQRNEHLELQQRAPSLSAPVDDHDDKPHEMIMSSKHMTRVEINGPETIER